MTADDYFAVQNLVYRYCHLIDRADFAGIGTLFGHAAIYVPALPEPVRGAAAVEAMYRNFTRVYPETGTPRTRHVTSNLIIEPLSATRARASSYVLVHQAAPQLPLQPIIGGGYQDLFEKADGVWRFSERRMEMDLFGDLSAHLLQQYGPDR